MKNQAVNPYLPGWEHVPDGEPHVFNERIYIFGSHDRFQGEDFCELNYVGWSAPVQDPGSFVYEGEIYDKTQDPYYREGNLLFAPDVCQGPDGRYYLYYSFDISGVIGVAVCDQPAGRYEYYGHVHYADGTLLGQKGEPFQYDPAILCEQGRVFLYTGFCIDMERIPRFRGLTPNKQGAMVTELETDMLTIRTPYRFLIPSSFTSEGTGFEGHAFFEASSIRSAEGRYYFIYFSEKSHELCYAVSEEPDRGFVYGGCLISNGDLGYHGNQTALNYTGTNHGSIEKIGQDWYVFYHRQTGGSPYGRQGCAERIMIDENGFIPQIPMTSCGLNNGPLDGAQVYPAGIACCLMSAEGAVPYTPRTHVDASHPYFYHEGGDFDPESEEVPPQIIVRNLRDGACVGYRYFDFLGMTDKTITYTADADGCLLIMSGRPETPDACIIDKVDITAGEKQHAVIQVPSEACTELWFRYQGQGSLDLITV